jgi:hypothetical protein
MIADAFETLALSPPFFWFQYLINPKTSLEMVVVYWKVSLEPDKLICHFNRGFWQVLPQYISPLHRQNFLPCSMYGSCTFSHGDRWGLKRTNLYCWCVNSSLAIVSEFWFTTLFWNFVLLHKEEKLAAVRQWLKLDPPYIEIIGKFVKSEVSQKCFAILWIRTSNIDDINLKYLGGTYVSTKVWGILFQFFTVVLFGVLFKEWRLPLNVCLIANS